MSIRSRRWRRAPPPIRRARADGPSCRTRVRELFGQRARRRAGSASSSIHRGFQSSDGPMRDLLSVALSAADRRSDRRGTPGLGKIGGTPPGWCGRRTLPDSRTCSAREPLTHSRGYGASSPGHRSQVVRPSRRLTYSTRMPPRSGRSVAGPGTQGGVFPDEEHNLIARDDVAPRSFAAREDSDFGDPATDPRSAAPSHVPPVAGQHDREAITAIAEACLERPLLQQVELQAE